MQSEQFQLHAKIEERHWWFVARRRIVRQLVEEVLPPNAGKTVIDVGCGTGANIAALADGYRTIGIDTSAEAIELARTRFPQTEFTCGFAPDALGDKFGEADLVMLNDVLEHVPDDSALLSSLLAAAKPGTYFLITVPADMALWSPHDVAFGHYRRYDLSGFSQLWQDQPVTTLLATPFNSRLYPLVRWIREKNRNRGESSGAAGTDFDIPVAPINALLRTIFQSEGNRLVRSLGQGIDQTGRRGVSLITLLRRNQDPTRQFPASWDSLAGEFNTEALLTGMP
jgi:SAM-dependent methyltransferase